MLAWVMGDSGFDWHYGVLPLSPIPDLDGLGLWRGFSSEFHSDFDDSSSESDADGSTPIPEVLLT